MKHSCCCVINVWMRIPLKGHFLFNYNLPRGRKLWWLVHGELGLKEELNSVHAFKNHIIWLGTEKALLKGSNPQMTKVHSDKGWKGRALQNVVVEVKLTISSEKSSSLLWVANITARLKSAKTIMRFTTSTIGLFQTTGPCEKKHTENMSFYIVNKKWKNVLCGRVDVSTWHCCEKLKEIFQQNWFAYGAAGGKGRRT